MRTRLTVIALMLLLGGAVIFAAAPQAQAFGVQVYVGPGYSYPYYYYSPPVYYYYPPNYGYYYYNYAPPSTYYYPYYQPYYTPYYGFAWHHHHRH